MKGAKRTLEKTTLIHIVGRGSQNEESKKEECKMENVI